MYLLNPGVWTVAVHYGANKFAIGKWNRMCEVQLIFAAPATNRYIEQKSTPGSATHEEP